MNFELRLVEMMDIVTLFSIECFCKTRLFDIAPLIDFKIFLFVYKKITVEEKVPASPSHNDRRLPGGLRVLLFKL